MIYNYRLHTFRDIVEKQKLFTLIIHGTEAPFYTKQEESARERALCQLTECF